MPTQFLDNNNWCNCAAAWRFLGLSGAASQMVVGHFCSILSVSKLVESKLASQHQALATSLVPVCFVALHRHTPHPAIDHHLLPHSSCLPSLFQPSDTQTDRFPPFIPWCSWASVCLPPREIPGRNGIGQIILPPLL